MVSRYRGSLHALVLITGRWQPTSNNLPTTRLVGRLIIIRQGQNVASTRLLQNGVLEGVDWIFVLEKKSMTGWYEHDNKTSDFVKEGDIFV
jgi:hypothetical protein